LVGISLDRGYHADGRNRYRATIESARDHLTKSGHPYHLISGDDQVLVLRSYSKLGAPFQVFLFGHSPGSAIVHPDVQEVYAALVFAIVAPHVCPGTASLEYHRCPMELGVAGMKDVAGHRSS
jgi:hypothetical protein